MKKVGLIVFLVILSFSIVSASWFSDLISGGVVKKQEKNIRDEMIKCSADKPCSFGRVCMYDDGGNTRCKYKRLAGKSWKPLDTTFQCQMLGPGLRECWIDGKVHEVPECNIGSYKDDSILVPKCNENKDDCIFEESKCNQNDLSGNSGVLSWKVPASPVDYAQIGLMLTCREAEANTLFSEVPDAKEKEAVKGFIMWNYLAFANSLNLRYDADGNPIEGFTEEEAEQIIAAKQAFCLPSARVFNNICFSGWETLNVSVPTGKLPTRSYCDMPNGKGRTWWTPSGFNTDILCHSQSKNYATCPVGTVCVDKEKKTKDCKVYMEAECVKMAGGVTIPDTATTETCIPETETTAPPEIPQT